jgi:hypothetical protein
MDYMQPVEGEPLEGLEAHMLVEEYILVVHMYALVEHIF